MLTKAVFEPRRSPLLSRALEQRAAGPGWAFLCPTLLLLHFPSQPLCASSQHCPNPHKSAPAFPYLTWHHEKFVSVIILPTDQTTYEDEMLPDKCLTRGQSWFLALKTSPTRFIFFAGAGTSYLRGPGGSTMTVETGKPLKENCLTNREVLGGAFIGRRELSRKRL